MANPTWFNEQDYLTSKLDKLKAADSATYGSWTTEQVKAAIEGAGLTTFEHFEQFNQAEGTSPSQYFNAYEYIGAKVKALNTASVDGRTNWTQDEVKAAFDSVGGAWAHYQQFGAAEGLNPSNAFSAEGYYAAKAASLGGEWTAASVKEYFVANGINPLDHYLSTGKTEGVAPVAASESERVPADPTANVGKSFALTAEVDTIIGTTGNDVGTGTSATLQVGDTIIDESTTDNDVLNLTLTAENVAARISNIENINVTWDAFGDASFEAANVTGATINLTSSKLGFLGNATVKNAGANKVVAGEGMKGTLTVQDVTAGTVTATAAKVVNVDAKAGTADDSVTVIAGAATTTMNIGAGVGGLDAFDNATVVAGVATTDVVVSATKSVNVTAGAATKNLTTTSASTTIDASAVAKDAAIAVNGTAGNTDTAVVKLGNDAVVTTALLTGAEKLTLDVADGKAVTIGAGSTIETIDVQGAGAVTLKTTAADLSGDTVTKSNAGALSVELTGAALAATFDSSKIAADSFKLKAGAGAALDVKSGQSFEVAADGNTATLAIKTATGGTTDTARVKLTSAQYASVTSGTNAATDINTLTIEAAAAQAAGAATAIDLTIDDLVAGNANTVVLTGTNDVKLTKVTSAKEINASALNGTLNIGAGIPVATGIIAGATGVNTIAFGAVLADTSVTFIGQGGNDVVTLGSVAASAGANSAAGQANIVLGAGNDKLTAGAISGVLSVQAGEGDDSVELTAAPVGAATVVVEFGTGTDTLKLSTAAVMDFSAANLTVTGMEKLDIGTVETTVSASQFASFGAFELVGSAKLIVDGSSLTTAQTIDASKVTLNFGSSATTELKGGSGNDTILGTIGNDTIVGGTGADILTGGTGANTFKFTKGDTGTPSATVFDTITDWKAGTGNLIDYTDAGITLVAEGSADVAGTAAISGTGLATFNAADSTLAQQIAAVEKAMTTDTAVAGEAAVWAVGSDSYIFISDGVAGVGANDILIKVTGVAATTGLTLLSGDISAIA